MEGLVGLQDSPAGHWVAEMAALAACASRDVHWPVGRTQLLFVR